MSPTVPPTAPATSAVDWLSLVPIPTVAGGWVVAEFMVPIPIVAGDGVGAAFMVPISTVGGGWVVAEFMVPISTVAGDGVVAEFMVPIPIVAGDGVGAAFRYETSKNIPLSIDYNIIFSVASILHTFLILHCIPCRGLCGMQVKLIMPTLCKFYRHIPCRGLCGMQVKLIMPTLCKFYRHLLIHTA